MEAATKRDPAATWWLSFTATLCLLLLPFIVVDVPPVLDFPNHLARQYVLAFGAADPILSRFYSPHWGVIPNLAIDLVTPPLMRVLPIDVAGRVVLAVGLILPLIGAIMYHRAVFKRRSPWPLAAGLVSTNGLFFLGFMNFLWATGLALIVAAVWISARDRRPALAMGVAAFGALAIFFCHIFGLVFFAVLIGSQELARREARLRMRRLWRAEALRGAVMVALPLAPALLLFAVVHHGQADGPAIWSSFSRKLTFLFVPFLTYDKWVGLLTGFCVLLLVILSVARGWLRLDRGSGFAMLIIWAAYLVCPRIVAGGTFVDVRLTLFLALMLFAGCLPQFPRQTVVVVTSVVPVLLAIRTATIASAWAAHNHDLDAMRASIAAVPPGDRVLVVTAFAVESEAYAARQPSSRTIPGLYRTDLHLPALLVIERRAFWPQLFSDPTQQPLITRPPFDTIAAMGEPPDYRLLATAHPAPDDRAAAASLADWGTRFDDVLVLDAGAVPDLADFLPDRLSLVNRSDVVALFRIRPAQSSAPTDGEIRSAPALPRGPR